jgi:hypothetical protein
MRCGCRAIRRAAGTRRMGRSLSWNKPNTVKTEACGYVTPISTRPTVTGHEAHSSIYSWPGPLAWWLPLDRV